MRQRILNLLIALDQFMFCVVTLGDRRAEIGL